MPIVTNMVSNGFTSIGCFSRSFARTCSKNDALLASCWSAYFVDSLYIKSFTSLLKKRLNKSIRAFPVMLIKLASEWWMAYKE